MNYGTGATPSIAGVALLPFTGNNDTLFIVAISLIALGVAVFIVSLVLARKNRQASKN
jgi:hypothetical protein